MEKLLIRNARAVLPDGVRVGMSVLVENGIISSIAPHIPNSGDLRVVDAGGLYLSPGFIDLHTHGRDLVDAMDNSRDSLAAIARGLLPFGVTSFLITTQAAPIEKTLEVIKTAVEYIKNPEPEFAIPLGIYLEGPYFAEAKKGAQQVEDTYKIDLSGLRAMLEAGEGLIRVTALAPELLNAVEAVKMITAYGAVAAAAHTNSGFDAAKRAIDAGVSLSTHTFNGMRQLEHREPGIVGAVLSDSRVTCEAIADGVHLHPAVVKLIYLAKGAGKMALVSDSVAATGIPDGEYDYGGRNFSVSGGIIRLTDGTLAGSTLSLSKAVSNTIAFTGCPMHEAVEMASLTPARVIGVHRKKGGIEVGKDADLILFDDDIKVRSVILGGRCISI